ncbi:hypothetical protein O4J56_16445 [Nocardiopsis sp. RSe5-2]|uniref:ATP-binding protein n=1 Tax=Nocardiopsis endophytica TaxID=3018445 RepID=A0ABT4U5L2_9ACTN|nr:hypothetical protein [Nocardiopsis endophytica]MDA2812236.1 hypothetical protein [Nocardiopsis endophytica]
MHGDAPNTACPATGLLARPRPFHVTIGLLDGYLHVLECGAGSGHCTIAPAPSPDPLAETGRGLTWVDAMAQRWGTYGDAASRTVWFMLDRPSMRPA